MSNSGANFEAISGAGEKLAKLPVHTSITSNTTLVAGEISPVNATSAPITVFLPTGKPFGTLIAVEKEDGTENVVTVSGSIRGEATTDTLKLKRETVLYQTETSGSWRPFADHKTLGSLDTRYIANVLEPTVYVSKNGNDKFSGLSWSQSFLTVHKAIESLKTLSGGTGSIYVGVGKFVEKALVRPTNCSIYGQGPFLTEIFLAANENSNLLQDAVWGESGKVSGPGLITDIQFNANKAEQTITYAETLTTTTGTMSTSSTTSVPVLNMAERLYGTGSFPTSEKFWMGNHLCEYTEKTETELKGVKAVFSGFTWQIGMVCVPFASKGNGLALQSDRVTLRNVRVEGAVGSGIIFQGSGTNEGAQFSYQNKIENTESYSNEKYGIEVIFASDSQVDKISYGGNEKGAIWAGGVDWTWDQLHPISATQFNGARASQIITIVASRQRFNDFFVDRAAYESIVIDGRPFNSNLTDIKLDGELFVPSGSSSGAGAGLLLRGAGSSQSIKGLRVRLAVPGRVSQGVSNGPLTFLVGKQNLAAPTEGKVQVISTRSFAPNSSMGGKLTVAGSGTLEYTGEKHFGTGTKTAAIGATKLQLIVPAGETLAGMGLEPSGTITVYPPSTSESSVSTLKLTYTKIAGTFIEGIPASGEGSITETLPEETGVGQHFFLGVTGGTGTEVEDGTEITQLSMKASEVTGDIWINGRQNLRASTPISGVTSAGEAGFVFKAGGTWTTPVEGIYRLSVCGGGAGGGGGGADSLTGGVTAQVGGGGGGAGQMVEQVVSLASGVVITAVIGAGGGGGAGGTASSNTEGHAGVEGTKGSNSTLTGTGVSNTAFGGWFGAGGGADSTTTAGGGQYAGREAGLALTSTESPAGWGGPAASNFGFAGGAAIGTMGRGGGGGAPSSATEGGSGGTNKAINTKTGTTEGGSPANAPSNTGQGGDGGGGGAPGGKGGKGGEGGSGWAAIILVSRAL